MEDPSNFTEDFFPEDKSLICSFCCVSADDASTGREDCYPPGRVTGSGVLLVVSC